MIVKDYTTPYWNDLLDQLASDLDRAKLLAWIDEESAGFPQALGAVTEVGIFCIDMQDGGKYGGTTDTLHTNFCASASSQQRVRDLTDDEEQLQVTCGVAMVRDYLSTAQSQLSRSSLSWDDDDTWCLVKLRHALPTIGANILPAAAQNEQAADWGTFRAYCEAMSVETMSSLVNIPTDTLTSRKYWPMDRFFVNAERVGYADGAGLVSSSGGLSTLGKAIVSIAILVGILYYGGRSGLV